MLSCYLSNKKLYFWAYLLNFQWWNWQVSLFALSLWSFYFASVCALGLLVYVGYIIFAFPSLQLHRLNGLLLIFILLWAGSTYIFNVAFACLNLELGKVNKVIYFLSLFLFFISVFILWVSYIFGPWVYLVFSVLVLKSFLL